MHLDSLGHQCGVVLIMIFTIYIYMSRTLRSLACGLLLVTKAACSVLGGSGTSSVYCAWPDTCTHHVQRPASQIDVPSHRASRQSAQWLTEESCAGGHSPAGSRQAVPKLVCNLPCIPIPSQLVSQPIGSSHTSLCAL
eukprot:GHRQ01032814.1.p1 GENE.GHRQ01032814.1~~GHRQ01032814.1.p1  ORF type:complete len:138 (-),score=6.20 GHRQ01032814.1:142-555(-)